MNNPKPKPEEHMGDVSWCECDCHTKGTPQPDCPKCYKPQPDWFEEYKRLAEKFWPGDPLNWASNFNRKDLYETLRKVEQEAYERGLREGS